MTFNQLIRRFHREESGQDLVEYALVRVAVATVVISGSIGVALALAIIRLCGTREHNQ